MSETKRHKPAFANRIVKLMELTKGQILLDCTLGDGGHSQEALTAGVRVISLDVDAEAIKRAKSFIPAPLQKDLSVFRANFARLKQVFEEHHLPRPDAILMDLGASQNQFADSSRGFSFQKDAPLDMRFDDRLQVSAKDLVNALSAKELARLFADLADESKATQVAKRIVAERQKQPLSTTGQLAAIVTAAKLSKQARAGKAKAKTGIHPATKVFQALRMAVNLERESLEQGLKAAFSLLKSPGTLGIISFHSGEDRIVKRFFAKLNQEQKARLLHKKPVKPTIKEILKNNKIRSAKLRLISKI